MTSNRERGVTVQKLDLSAIYDEATRRRREQDPAVVACDSTYEWAKATAPNGITYLICTEGVGYPVSDDDPVEIDLYDKIEVDGKKSFSIIPNAIAKLTPAELAELPVTGEVDLADFVRRFGDRLERNFRIWRDNLTAVELPEDEEPVEEMSPWRRWSPSEYASDPPGDGFYYQANLGDLKGQVWRDDEDELWTWHVVAGDSFSTPERDGTARDLTSAQRKCGEAMRDVYDADRADSVR